jgi:hypothetical protein
MGSGSRQTELAARATLLFNVYAGCPWGAAAETWGARRTAGGSRPIAGAGDAIGRLAGAGRLFELVAAAGTEGIDVSS